MNVDFMSLGVTGVHDESGINNKNSSKKMLSEEMQ